MNAETIDHTLRDVADAVLEHHPDGVDVLIRLLGDDVRALDRTAIDHDATALLKPGGRLASTLPPADPDALRARGLILARTMVSPAREPLERLARLVTSGNLHVPRRPHRRIRDDHVTALAVALSR